ncbi:RNA-binding protein [candidate division GN15 bacterium]|uniref:RNA-binding protein n=1 Tax=candidate division GN15 bacterium TaxID=2072418 RepID=A0A855X802_9BACT|nr:MAG: RNA-binding protein [candidate division GN15 bacterium]
MKIFVGNLAGKTGEQDLRTAFQVFGKVDHVNIAKTNLDGQSRGFGFVDVAVDSDARDAIARLNGSTMHGNILRVSEAHRKPHTD